VDVRSPIIGWLWIVIIVLLAMGSIARGGLTLRIIAVAAALITILLREQILPAHVRNAVWDLARSGTPSDEFRRGALDTLAIVLGTRKFTIAGALLLSALAVASGRRRKTREHDESASG
jgi:hypothetical protein